MVDAEDYERAVVNKWRAIIKDDTVYASNGTLSGLHRFIMGLSKGQGGKIDHENHDGLNCRRRNLRFASSSQNTANSRKWRKDKISRFKGVCIDRRKKARPWYATIRFNYKQYNLGLYATEEEAARAYDKAALKFFGPFANINFPS